MSSFERLNSCAELTTEDAEAAASSSTTLKELFAWASRIAKPGGGAPKLLMALAKMAHAEWVDGSPTVEIGGSSAHTTISVFVEHGMGIRERIVPFTRFDVPVDEFARAIRLAPKIIAPFRSVQRAGVLVLELEGATRAAAEAIAIDPSSLHQKKPDSQPKPAAPAAKAPGVKGPLPRPIMADAAVHTHPTVRRMVAVRPEALRSGNDDD